MNVSLLNNARKQAPLHEKTVPGRNGYAYINHDPVNYIDLWGLEANDVRKILIGVGWIDGSVQSGTSKNSTVNAGVIVSGSWDLDNVGNTGLPTDGVSFGSVGGGVWRNYTGTLGIK